MENIVIKDLKHLGEAARKLLSLGNDRKLYAFYGAMGSGKTTLIKALCSELKVIDTVTSPTFTLVNEYRTTEGDPVYHIDFYRIRKKEEVFDFGIEEYLSEGYFCFMEWPELVGDIIPPETIRIKITVEDDESRILTII